MKKQVIVAILFISLLFLSSCKKNQPVSKPIDPSIEQEQPDPAVEQAKQTILEAAPQLKSSEYELSLSADPFALNNSTYYRCEVKKSGKLLDPVILVDQQSGEILTYYAEGAIYEIETDPLFGTQAISKWNGTYTKQASTKENFVTIEMGMSDRNTFEFTLYAQKDGKWGEIKSQAAQIDYEDNTKAVFDNQDGFRLLFQFEEENLKIKSEGLNIYSDSSISFDGTYEMTADSVDK